MHRSSVLQRGPIFTICFKGPAVGSVASTTSNRLSQFNGTPQTNDVIGAIIACTCQHILPEWLNETTNYGDDLSFFDSIKDVAKMLRTRSQYILALFEDLCCGDRRVTASADCRPELAALSDDARKLNLIAESDAGIENESDLVLHWLTLMEWAADPTVDKTVGSLNEALDNFSNSGGSDDLQADESGDSLRDSPEASGVTPVPSPSPCNDTVAAAAAAGSDKSDEQLVRNLRLRGKQEVYSATDAQVTPNDGHDFESERRTFVRFDELDRHWAKLTLPPGASKRGRFLNLVQSGICQASLESAAALFPVKAMGKFAFAWQDTMDAHKLTTVTTIGPCPSFSFAFAGSCSLARRNPIILLFIM